MKRLIIALLFALGLSAQAPSYIRVALNAVTTTTTSSAVNNVSAGIANWYVTVHVTGAPAGCTISLKSSSDNVTYTDVTASSGANPFTCTSDTVVPIGYASYAAYFKVALTALSGGTSPTVTATIIGYGPGFSSTTGNLSVAGCIMVPSATATACSQLTNLGPYFADSTAGYTATETSSLNIRTSYTGADSAGPNATVIAGSYSETTVSPSADITSGNLYLSGVISALIIPGTNTHTVDFTTAGRWIAEAQAPTSSNYTSDGLAAGNVVLYVGNQVTGTETGTVLSDSPAALTVGTQFGTNALISGNAIGGLASIDILSTGNTANYWAWDAWIYDLGDTTGVVGNYRGREIFSNSAEQVGWLQMPMSGSPVAIGMDIRAVTAAYSGTLTSDNTNVANTATVVVGAKTYTFKTTLAACAANDVKIGSTAVLSLKNLALTLKVTGTAGVNYCAGTTTNSAASGYILANGALVLTVLGTTTSTLTGATHLVASAANLVAGEGYAIRTAAGEIEFADLAAASGTRAIISDTDGALSTLAGVNGITGRSVAATGALASVVSVPNGAADASYIISANVLVTTATLHNFTVTVAYTDEGNTSRTLTMNFSTVAGVIATTIVNTGGAVPYEGLQYHIRCKANTSITIATTGTFTTVTYNVEGYIAQIG